MTACDGPCDSLCSFETVCLTSDHHQPWHSTSLHPSDWSRFKNSSILCHVPEEKAGTLVDAAPKDNRSAWLRDKDTDRMPALQQTRSGVYTGLDTRYRERGDLACPYGIRTWNEVRYNPQSGPLPRKRDYSSDVCLKCLE